MKLSISGYKKYVQCPRMYKLHYVDRIRPTVTTSALVFGSAIDEALNALLEGKVDVAGACTVFDNNFHPEAEFTMYDNKDYDPLLLTEEDKEELLVECKAAGYPGDDIDGLMKDLFKVQGRNAAYFDNLSEAQRTCLHLGCRLSLKLKAYMILETYNEEVIPKLKNIQNVQLEVGDGNKVRGYLDFSGEIDGVFRELDNKTAKNKYTKYNQDSSIQLKLYAHLRNNYEVGYIVIHKEVKHYKTRPSKIDIDFHLFSVDNGECEDVYNTVLDVHKHIENGVFPKNLTACHAFYGRNCPYLEYCKNKDMKGLKHE